MRGLNVANLSAAVQLVALLPSCPLEFGIVCLEEDEKVLLLIASSSTRRTSSMRVQIDSGARVEVAQLSRAGALW